MLCESASCWTILHSCMPPCPPPTHPRHRQALGILAEVEGAAFARRVPALLPQLADLLASRADADAEAAEAAAEAAAEGEDLLAAAPGWQEAYYSLLLLQRLLEAATAQLAWAAGDDARACWGGAQRLLLHRHQWVRKAAGRLVGGGLAAPGVGEPWLDEAGAGAAGALALAFFRQLDSDAADEALGGQAVKCLVFLCARMHADDAAAGRLPPPLKLAGGGAAALAADELGAAALNGHAASNGGGESAAAEEGSMSEGEDSEGEEEAGGEGEAGEAAAAAAADASDSDVEEDAAEASAADEAAAGSLTLHGLVRRVARLADDKTYARQLQRGVALRFVAALASRLGPQRVGPYLPLLMRPLYRITEPGERGGAVGPWEGCRVGSLAACAVGAAASSAMQHHQAQEPSGWRPRAHTPLLAPLPTPPSSCCRRHRQLPRGGHPGGGGGGPPAGPGGRRRTAGRLQRGARGGAQPARRAQAQGGAAGAGRRRGGRRAPGLPPILFAVSAWLPIELGAICPATNASPCPLVTLLPPCARRWWIPRRRPSGACASSSARRAARRRLWSMCGACAERASL